jgi:hypothetical protein
MLNVYSRSLDLHKLYGPSSPAPTLYPTFSSNMGSSNKAGEAETLKRNMILEATKLSLGLDTNAHTDLG